MNFQAFQEIFTILSHISAGIMQVFGCMIIGPCEILDPQVGPCEILDPQVYTPNLRLY